MWNVEATDRAPSIPNRAPNIDSSFKVIGVIRSIYRIAANLLRAVMLILV